MRTRRLVYVALAVVACVIAAYATVTIGVQRAESGQAATVFRLGPGMSAAIACSADGKTVFVADATGVYRSTEAGAAGSWQKVLSD